MTFRAEVSRLNRLEQRAKWHYYTGKSRGDADRMARAAGLWSAVYNKSLTVLRGSIQPPPTAIVSSGRPEDTAFKLGRSGARPGA